MQYFPYLYSEEKEKQIHSTSFAQVPRISSPVQQDFHLKAPIDYFSP